MLTDTSNLSRVGFNTTILRQREFEIEIFTVSLLMAPSEFRQDYYVGFEPLCRAINSSNYSWKLRMLEEKRMFFNLLPFLFFNFIR